MHKKEASKNPDNAEEENEKKIERAKQRVERREQ